MVTIRGILIALVIVTSVFVSFILGFREGSQVSLWSDFVLRGVVAGQRLAALEKGNEEFVRTTLKADISLGIQAHTVLLQLRGYDYLSPITGVELYGLKSEYVDRLEQYKILNLRTSGTPQERGDPNRNR
jgi:hypothetical protein